MATLNEIARNYADELQDGIAWILVWKTGRSWNATAVWLDRLPSGAYRTPDDLPADMAWRDVPATEAPDPYVYDGHMSPEDYELMHKNRFREEKPPDEAPHIHLSQKGEHQDDKHQ